MRFDISVAYKLMNVKVFKECNTWKARLQLGQEMPVARNVLQINER